MVLQAEEASEEHSRGEQKLDEERKQSAAMGKKLEGLRSEAQHKQEELDKVLSAHAELAAALQDANKQLEVPLPSG